MATRVVARDKGLEQARLQVGRDAGAAVDHPDAAPAGAGLVDLQPQVAGVRLSGQAGERTQGVAQQVVDDLQEEAAHRVEFEVPPHLQLDAMLLLLVPEGMARHRLAQEAGGADPLRRRRQAQQARVGDLRVDLPVHVAHQGQQPARQVLDLLLPHATAGPHLLAHGLADQVHRGQGGAQLVGHDAHGVQRLLELLTPQVGGGHAQHQTRGRAEDEDHGLRLRLRRCQMWGHRPPRTEQQPPGGQAGGQAQQGEPPVGEVQVDEQHRRGRREPDRIAAVAQVHPGEVDGQRDPEQERRDQGGGSRGRAGRERRRGHQDQAEQAHGQALPGVVIRLRRPACPQQVEERVAHRGEQAERAHAPGQGVLDRVEQQGQQGLAPGLQAGAAVGPGRSPVGQGEQGAEAADEPSVDLLGGVSAGVSVVAPLRPLGGPT